MQASYLRDAQAAAAGEADEDQVHPGIRGTLRFLREVGQDRGQFAAGQNLRGRTTTTYDAADQIVYSVAAAGLTTYVFDKDGNQQVVKSPDGTRVTTTWNFENQPTQYNQPANATYPVVTMAYDGDNQRVQKQSSAGTTKFIWDEQNYLAEANASNVIQNVYTNEPQGYGSLVSTRISGTTSYHQFDALGSTRQLTNAAGATTDTALYDAWGTGVTRTGATAAQLLWLGMIGYYADTETELVWVRIRLYGPTIARWLSPDVVPPPDEANGYPYAANNPAVRNDPSGALSIVPVNGQLRPPCGGIAFEDLGF